MILRLTGALLLLQFFWLSPLAGETSQGSRASLVTVEGEVRSVERTPGEGDLEVLSLRLAPRQGGEEMEILLAPEPALKEIGFDVQEGDTIRVRVFTEAGASARAHKIMNLSRSTMVRLRTLHQIPLWDSTGAWQGGTCRQSPGGTGQRRRGGGGPPH